MVTIATDEAARQCIKPSNKHKQSYSVHMCLYTQHTNIRMNIKPKTIQEHTHYSATHHPQPTTDMQHTEGEIGSIWGVPSSVSFVSACFSSHDIFSKSFANGAKIFK